MLPKASSSRAAKIEIENTTTNYTVEDILIKDYYGKGETEKIHQS